MLIITGSHRSDRRGTQRLRNVHVAVAILGSLLCLDRAPAAESRPDKRPMLRVPLTDSKPVVDGKLAQGGRMAFSGGDLYLAGGDQLRRVRGLLPCAANKKAT